MSISNYLKRTNRLLFLGCGIALMFIINFTILNLPFAESVSDVDEINELKEYGFWGFFFIVVLIVPIFETIVLQYIPIKIIRFILKNQRPQLRNLFAVIVSSALFSLTHNYSVTYIIVTFLGGLVLAYSFVFSCERRESPILNVFVIHSIYNAICFVFNEVV